MNNIPAGSNDALIYVSPKTGRAVSASAGEPYRDRLLALPPFLRGERGSQVRPDDLTAGFAMTGHFLASRVFAPRDLQIPEGRARMIDLIERLER